MMTFKEFLEGRETWNTTEPKYDINLASDSSQEENDSTIFLKPFAKKIKAFGYYCDVAAKSTDEPRLSNNIGGSERRQKKLSTSIDSRVSALSGLMKINRSDYIHHIQEFRDALYGLARRFHKMFYNLNYLIRKSDSADQIFEDIVIDVEEAIEELNWFKKWSDHHLSDKEKTRIFTIKEKLESMNNFLTLSLSQLKTMKDIGKKTTKPLIPYGGRSW